MAAAGIALRFENVVKDYPRGWFGRRSLRALDQISMEVASGQIVGLLGPNRAGKTTLIKSLLSLCRVTSGRIERLGASSSDRRTLARIGYVHENHAFPRYLTAKALLEYYGAMTLLSAADLARRVPQLLDRVGLTEFAKDPIARFSKGMNQRLAIAQAMLQEPELLVLDEPTEGLDLEGRQMLRSVVAEQKAAGRTVLYVSHVLSELEPLCDQAAVLVAGRLAFFGTLPELMKRESAPSLDAAVAHILGNPHLPGVPAPHRSLVAGVSR